MRERAQRVSLPEAIANLAPVRERALAERQRALQLSAQVALVRAELEQLGAFRGRRALGEPKRTLVLGDRLPVCAERGRPGGGGRREPEHRRAVLRGLGVMGQAREIGGAARR